MATVWARLDDRWQGMLKHRWWCELRAEFGIVGTVRTQEVGWTVEAGWGPHVHALLLTREPWSEPVRAAVFKRIGEWFRKRREVGPPPQEPGVGKLPPPGPGGAGEPPEDGGEDGPGEGKVDSPKLPAGAYGSEVRDPAAVAQYMVGGPAKGGEGRLFRLVREAPALWLEYERAVYRRKAMRWSPSLKGLFLIDVKPDEKLPADHRVMLTLDPAEWRRVVAEDRVGALRIAARRSVHHSR